MNKENITKLKMTKKRDGVKVGSILVVELTDGKLSTKYNGTSFGDNWIMSAVRDGVAKPVVKTYG